MIDTLLGDIEAFGKIKKRDDPVFLQGMQIFRIALSMIDGYGMIRRYWCQGGDADQPADLWEVVNYIADGVRRIQAEKMKR